MKKLKKGNKVRLIVSHFNNCPNGVDIATKCSGKKEQDLETCMIEQAKSCTNGDGNVGFWDTSGRIKLIKLSFSGFKNV